MFVWLSVFKKNTGQGQLRFLYTGQGHIRLVLYKVKWDF